MKDTPCTLQNPVDPSPDYPSGADVTYICLEPTCGWHGADAPEDSDGIVYCPNCGGKLTYAAQCRDCGEWFPSDQVKDGRCPECYVEWKAIQPELDTAHKAIWDFVDNIKTIRGQK
jgi:DNA-directed RNA polymerase subunit RPC12/RpoP